MQGKEENNFSEIEELYLQTTFDEMDIFTNFAVNVADKNVAGSRLVINQNLRERLENYLSAMSEKLLNSCAPKVSLKFLSSLYLCSQTICFHDRAYKIFFLLLLKMNHRH